MFLQNTTRANHIPTTWVLLDSCSTVLVFNTKKYVTNIREAPKMLTPFSNCGHQSSTEIADTKYFGQVWYNKNSLANISSLADVCKVSRVTMDSELKNSMYVHCKDRLVMDFKKYRTGLYYFDVAEHMKNRILVNKLVMTIMNSSH